jgi:peptidoglycan/LPS O-acetylase OafA/YrhL
MPTLNRPVYSKEIDALRAIAVLAVVFYHFKFELFSGGFVGVDVFFVISGYLITYIMFNLCNGNLNFFEFYSRRILRIFPALIVMLGVVLFFSFFIFSPAINKEIAGVSLSQLLFSSNFYLFRITSDYFSQTAEINPFLHTWSLSVEEQFYFIIPAVIFVFSIKLNRNILTVLITLFLASFMLNIIWSNLIAGVRFGNPALWKEGTYGNAAFYFVLARGWEFLAGSIIAYYVFFHNIRISRDWLAELGSGLGLLFLLSSFIYLDASVSFPGYWAILPVLGATLFIICNVSNSTFIGRILGAKPLVFIGLISYSLYLWHWPLWVFVSKFHSLDSSLSKVSLLFVSMGFAYCSYRFVEQPFRRSNFSQVRKLLTIGVACLMLFAVSLWIYLGAWSSPQAQGVDSSRELLINPRRGECHAVRPLEILKAKGLCAFGVSNHLDTLDVIALGDSHLDAVYPVIAEVSSDLELSGQYVSYSSCIAIPGLFVRGDRLRDCYEARDWIINYAISKSIGAVLLVGRWSVYIGDSKEGSSSKHLAVLKGTDFNRESALRSFEISLGNLAKKLDEKNIKLIVMLEVPNHKVDVSESIFAIRQVDRNFGFEASYPTIPVTEYISQQKNIREVLERLSLDNLNLWVVDPKKSLCTFKDCISVDQDGVLMYRDNNHLSVAGSKRLKTLFENIMSRLKDGS